MPGEQFNKWTKEVELVSTNQTNLFSDTVIAEPQQDERNYVQSRQTEGRG